MKKCAFPPKTEPLHKNDSCIDAKMFKKEIYLKTVICGGKNNQHNLLKIKYINVKKLQHYC